MMSEVYDHISDADVSLAADKINQFSKLTQSKLKNRLSYENFKSPTTFTAVGLYVELVDGIEPPTC